MRHRVRSNSLGSCFSVCSPSLEKPSKRLCEPQQTPQRPRKMAGRAFAFPAGPPSGLAKSPVAFTRVQAPFVSLLARPYPPVPFCSHTFSSASSLFSCYQLARRHVRPFPVLTRRLRRAFSTAPSSSVSSSPSSRASSSSSSAASSSSSPASPSSAEGSGKTAGSGKKSGESFFLSLCELEQKKRTERAIQHSQDLWKKRTAAKDAHSEKTPELYDGPFWLKFWRRKKRPGARG
ncbi:hypothetical protein TGMAS_318340 [Toxoplasma gondii MAS]|uniref:Uncharacterized protein n=1 Tax=Toxoplasma gondii MAS TaxID=943118 RepID=A0A086PMP4_TOXGO|nr:hypothetical protein TGMAS_318340 [Toxoplasma gondii MAS]